VDLQNLTINKYSECLGFIFNSWVSYNLCDNNQHFVIFEVNFLITHKIKFLILNILIAISVVSVVLLKRIPQDPDYHIFADSKKFFGIPNFWNVISNVPFLAVGVFGLMRENCLEQKKSQWAYIILCVGVFLIGLGSAYYHVTPSTPTLVWDRLPMTIGFISLFWLLLEERVYPAISGKTLTLFIFIGAGSVGYWAWSESRGVGDLRLYALVQFLPIILMPTILFLFKRNYLSNGYLVLSFVFYVGAKIFEHFDWQTQHYLTYISGHTIKHLLASVAVLCIVLAVPSKK